MPSPAVPVRIMLIDGLVHSIAPADAAMQEVWPQAMGFHLSDTSLAADLAALGGLTPVLVNRFLALGRYARNLDGAGGRTAGILFTCSAFGPAIQRVRDDLDIPVLAPNEAAFDEALALCVGRPDGGRIGMIASFAPALEPLMEEMAAMAAATGQMPPELYPIVAVGALDALARGDLAAHDHAAVAALDQVAACDVMVICQFSLARSAALVRSVRSEPVLTTPHAAVSRLRRLVEARGGNPPSR